MPKLVNIFKNHLSLCRLLLIKSAQNAAPREGGAPGPGPLVVRELTCDPTSRNESQWILSAIFAAWYSIDFSLK